MGGQNLSENLLRDLLASVLIKVLEETLAIKSVFLNNFLKSNNNIVNNLTFLFSRLSFSVVGSGSNIIKC